MKSTQFLPNCSSQKRRYFISKLAYLPCDKVTHGRYAVYKGRLNSLQVWYELLGHHVRFKWGLPKEMKVSIWYSIQFFPLGLSQWTNNNANQAERQQTGPLATQSANSWIHISHDKFVRISTITFYWFSEID